jgi:gp16 family phage-associated protein
MRERTQKRRDSSRSGPIGERVFRAKKLHDYLQIGKILYNNAGMPAEDNRTAEQVAAWFRRNGITITAWAQENGFDAKTVYALVSGRTRGLRGRSHEAAVALGMKTTDDVKGEKSLKRKSTT